MRPERFPGGDFLTTCPLCSWRTFHPTPKDSWLSLYYHLRRHHNHARAAEYTERVRKTLWRYARKAACEKSDTPMMK